MEAPTPARRRSRRDIRREETRQLLLQAAALLFARHGYDGVSLDTVAEEAGFSKGAVYWNFSSKQDLLASILELHCERQLSQVQGMLAVAMPLDERIRQISAAYFAPSEDAEDWCLLFVELWIQAMRERSLRPRLAQLYRATRQEVAHMIQEEAENLGMALTLPAEEVAAALLALGDGLMMQHFAGQSEVTSTAYASALRTLLRAVLQPVEQKQ